MFSNPARRVRRILLSSALLASMAHPVVGASEATIDTVDGQLANTSATGATKHLYTWLNGLDGQVLGGVHLAWKEVGRLTGKTPLLWGFEYFDIGPLERRRRDREAAKSAMIENFSAGGINTLTDHVHNFATGGKWKDVSVLPLPDLLPGRPLHSQYRNYLTRLAEFVKSIEHNGQLSPILYRPFHEMTGKWFWWGSRNRPEDFVELWRFTYQFLTQEMGCQNLIWVWSPNVLTRGGSRATYDQLWPGRRYVDIVGIDGYDNGPDGTFTNPAFRESYGLLSALTRREKAPLIWAEVGFRRSGSNVARFWMDDFLDTLINGYPEAKSFMLWRGPHMPAPDSPAASSMTALFNHEYVLTRDEIRRQDLYGAQP